MKRMLVTCCSVALVAGMAVVLPQAVSAESNIRSNTGCGLGNMAFQNVKSDSILIEVVAATLNGICGNQTFGITSGTLGCKKPEKFANNEKLNRFVAENMDSLALDMARGQGETLVTLAELMEVPAAQRAGFYSTLQTNFNSIYSSSAVESADVIDSIADIKSNS